MYYIYIPTIRIINWFSFRKKKHKFHYYNFIKLLNTRKYHFFYNIYNVYITPHNNIIQIWISIMNFTTLFIKNFLLYLSLIYINYPDNFLLIIGYIRAVYLCN